MSTDLVRKEEQAVVNHGAQFLDVIYRAASDPTVDVAKMQALLAMQERLEARQAEAAFNQAMARLQPKLPIIDKNGVIELRAGAKISYAKYEDIHAAVKPLLSAEGFTTSYSEAVEGANLKMSVTLSHIQGHSRSTSVFLPMTDDSGAKNKVQGAGSIISYGKRYALCCALDIVTSDQDQDSTQQQFQPITEEEKDILAQVIAEVGADLNGFLKYMKVEKLADIMSRDLKKAHEALEAKRRKGR